MIDCSSIKTPADWDKAMRALAKHGAKLLDAGEKADPAAKKDKSKQADTPDVETDEAAMDEQDETSANEPDDDTDD